MKQNQIIKAYVWLISTIRDYGPIPLTQINEMWMIDKIDEGNELNRQKLYRYSGDIREVFGVSIVYEKRKGYVIENPAIFKKGNIENWILSTQSVFYAIGDCSDLKDRIGVENIPSSEHFLKDCYGVMKDETLEVEDILIRAYGTEVNYLRDLPLHGSQTEVMQGDGWSDFRLRLRPSWDFIGKLMERGNRLKVLEPASVVLKIWAKHTESVKLYEENEDSSDV